MRVMVFVKATANSEAGEMPTAELLTEMGAFNQKLADAGVLLAGEGLHPTSRGKRIRFDGADRTVMDGPFPAVSELVAGYWIWQVKDMEEAVEWARCCPNPMPGPSELEIRGIYELEDLGEALTEATAALEQRRRGQTG